VQVLRRFGVLSKSSHLGCKKLRLRRTHSWKLISKTAAKKRFKK
jgi:hypothetical protein